MQRFELNLCALQFSLACGGAGIEFGAALLVVSLAGGRAIDFKSKLVEAIAICTRFVFESISTLRAGFVFGLHADNQLRLLLDRGADFGDLLLQLSALAGQ